MSDNKIRVGITQGDTNGIGWEVIIKTFADARMAELCTPVIYGSPKVATYYKNRLNDVEGFIYNPLQSVSQARRGKVNIIDCGPSEIPIEMGKTTKMSKIRSILSNISTFSVFFKYVRWVEDKLQLKMATPISSFISRAALISSSFPNPITDTGSMLLRF